MPLPERFQSSNPEPVSNVKREFGVPVGARLALLAVLAIASGLLLDRFASQDCQDDALASGDTNIEDALAESVFSQEFVAGGLEIPSSMDEAPDGRLFVAEQGGRVKIIENDQVLAEPFLTLPVITSAEGGLVGIKLSPEFSKDRQVFVYYKTRDENGALENRVSRFTASSKNPNLAEAGSEAILVFGIAQGEVHNGGGLEFDNSGMLLIGTGEAGDGINTSQNPSSLGGKILRVNPIDGSAPVDNPFIGFPNVDPRIYALGLRNPFTLSVDHTTGTILALDVGDHLFEEVDKIVPQGNYEWPYMEGPYEHQSLPDNILGTPTSPVYYYEHGEGSNAITGGDVIRNDAYPDALQGVYVIGDYIASTIKFFDPKTNKVFDLNISNGQIIRPVDLDFGLNGELYYLAIIPGWIFKITKEDRLTTPTPTAILTPVRGLTGDVNCDRVVNSIDAALILQNYAGLLPVLACVKAADVNRDGTVNAIDSLLILQLDAGLIPSL